MTDETRAILKTELGWAVKALVIALGVIFGLLGTMWLNLGESLAEVKNEVRGLRCEIQDVRLTAMAERTLLMDRIIRLEDQVGIDP